jgi:DNA primase small subunit
MREMSDPTYDFTQRLFLQYYTECFEEVGVKRKFEEREFAALLMRDKIMVRHKGFKTRGELQSFLRSMIPSDVYYSSAYYEQPDASEMGMKGWIGADLIFDIDADHIPTSCDKVHDEWTCIKCEFKGKGELPQKCPTCGGEKFEESTWPCEKCLTSAKAETTRLLDVLLKDFGFSEKDVSLFFSGHRGYHVHVENEAVEDLDAMARKEIVDYVMGLGFDAGLHGLEDEDARTVNLKDIGWRGRIARGIHRIILNASIEDYQNIGLKRNTAELIARNKDAILKSLNESRPWGVMKGLGPETYRRLVDFSKKSQSARVDTVVTTDIHRLIRLPGTLHGKTGFKKVEFPIQSLNDFDPFKSAIAFKGGAVSVLVSDAPEFRLGNQEFGPFRNEKVDLPIAAALLLICKKRAEVIA